MPKQPANGLAFNVYKIGLLPSAESRFSIEELVTSVGLWLKMRHSYRNVDVAARVAPPLPGTTGVTHIACLCQNTKAIRFPLDIFLSPWPFKGQLRETTCF